MSQLFCIFFFSNTSIFFFFNYRIPSPTRPLITRNSFQPSPPLDKDGVLAEVSSLDNDPTSQKGFYIQFDNDPPKRPKPPLRTKRGSPKKERSYVMEEGEEEQEQRLLEKRKQLERELDEEKLKEEEKRRQMMAEQEKQRLRAQRGTSQQESQKVAAASAIVIESDSSQPDPVSLYYCFIKTLL